MGKYLDPMFLLGLVLFSLFITLTFGCGSSTHTIKAEGESTVTHRVMIDDGICDELEGQDKVDCIKELLATLKKLSEAQNVSKSQD